MMTSRRLFADITPNVMNCLQREKFFTKLESHIFPDGTIDSNCCSHSFVVSTLVLSESGHDEKAREDVFEVMRSQGGFCDCEILLNVAPESAARAAYWKKKAKNTED
jgi:hypothetical protein